jgi:LexA-binding, inner membrane-associated putative hydrolase
MFIFGHLGIGLKLASPWERRFPKKLILLGTLLPDMIDKPVYYGLSWLTGKSGADLGIIAGTRSFGHTALALIAMTVASTALRLRWLAAISVGVATHLLLDNLGDRILKGDDFTARALAWPFLGWQFPPYPFSGIHQHLGQVLEPYFLITEAVGLSILLWEYWKILRRGEMARLIKSMKSIREDQ